MKKRLITPEKKNPEIIAPPSPRQRGSDNVIGKSPKIVVKDVRRTGSSLLPETSRIVSVISLPSAIFEFIFDTTTIAFVTTIPNRVKIPISAGNDREVPVSPKI